MSDETCLIWSVEHNAWWGPDQCGYVRRISQAGRYSNYEAVKICTRAMPGTGTSLGALPELPVRLADIEAMTDAYFEQYGQREEPWK